MSETSLPNTHITNIFSTPLVMRFWEDGSQLNVELRERILQHESKSKGVSKSNKGGWHSETGRLEFCGDSGKRLISRVLELADEATNRTLADERIERQTIRWTIETWANVNRNGAFNEVHTHPGSTWSGTYYVDAGEPSNGELGTRLLLLDPNPARINTFLRPWVSSKVLVRPREGLMVLFPSYVPHMVFPHEGAGTRISIAFNLRKEPYP